MKLQFTQKRKERKKKCPALLSTIPSHCLRGSAVAHLTNTEQQHVPPPPSATLEPSSAVWSARKNTQSKYMCASKPRPNSPVRGKDNSSSSRADGTNLVVNEEAGGEGGGKEGREQECLEWWNSVPSRWWKWSALIGGGLRQWYQPTLWQASIASLCRSACCQAGGS